MLDAKCDVVVGYFKKLVRIGGSFGFILNKGLFLDALKNKELFLDDKVFIICWNNKSSKRVLLSKNPRKIIEVSDSFAVCIDQQFHSLDGEHNISLRRVLD